MSTGFSRIDTFSAFFCFSLGRNIGQDTPPFSVTTATAIISQLQRKNVERKQVYAQRVCALCALIGNTAQGDCAGMSLNAWHEKQLSPSSLDRLLVSKKTKKRCFILATFLVRNDSESITLCDRSLTR